MNIDTLNTVATVYAAIAPILALIAAWAVKVLVAYLKTKTKSTIVQTTLERFHEAVGAAVARVNQTLVAEIKTAKANTSLGGAKITQAEADKLKAKVLTSVHLEYGGRKGLSAALAVLGVVDAVQVDKWVDDRIEAEVYAQKQCTKNP